MTSVTMTDAGEAVKQVRLASELIGRVRDVRVQVRVGWQQIDDLEAEAGEELKQRIAEVARAWAAEQKQAVQPQFEIQIRCDQSADVQTLKMSLPMIWGGEGDS